MLIFSKSDTSKEEMVLIIRNEVKGKDNCIIVSFDECPTRGALTCNDINNLIISVLF